MCSLQVVAWPSASQKMSNSFMAKQWKAGSSGQAQAFLLTSSATLGKVLNLTKRLCKVAHNYTCFKKVAVG